MFRFFFFFFQYPIGNFVPYKVSHACEDLEEGAGRRREKKIPEARKKGRIFIARLGKAWAFISFSRFAKKIANLQFLEPGKENSIPHFGLSTSPAYSLF